MIRPIADWSEVWALLIPLAFMFSWRKMPLYLRPIQLYLILALIINIISTVIWKRNQLNLHLPGWLDSNNFLYNTHSIIRLLLFSLFFIQLNQRFMHRVKFILPFLFLLFVVINFTVSENYVDANLSSRLLATEAALLLFYCLQYFIYLMVEDRTFNLKKEPGFWIVTGLSIYVATNFFIFLFYNYLTQQNWKFAVDIWDVHNSAYLVLCIFIAREFYERRN